MSHPATDPATPRTRRPSATQAAALLGLLLGVAVLPPTAADLQADIDQQLADLQAAQPAVEAAEQQIRQAMLQAEADEQALLKKLGQTHDELKRERARNAALEAELNRLRPADAPADPDEAGGTAPESETIDPATAPRPAATWLPWPPRELNPLGLVRSQETDLGPAPPGADGLTIHLPPPATTADTVTPLQARTEPARLVFERPGPSGDSVVVAELRIADGRLRWTWRSFSPLQLGDAMHDLDRRLRRAVIEVRAGQTPVLQSQFEPPRHTFGGISPGQDPVRFDGLPGETAGRLVPGPPAAGWALYRQSDQGLVWVSRSQTLAVALEAVPAEQSRIADASAPRPHLSVTVHRGPGLDERLADLDRQIAQWQRDLGPSAGPGADPQRAQDLIAQLQSERDELAALHPQLDAAANHVAASPTLRADLAFTLAGGQPQVTFFQFGFE